MPSLCCRIGLGGGCETSKNSPGSPIRRGFQDAVAERQQLPALLGKIVNL
jgi:hypothetical protein